MINKIRTWWRERTVSRKWVDVRQEILDTLGESKVKFEVTPYYFKVTSGKRTWYWNRGTGEFDGTSFSLS